MTPHRTIFLTLTVLATLVATCSSAFAGSLLSGYGGPGGGAQAIIGSTLVKGSGGSGGAGGGSTGSGGGATGAGAAVPASVSEGTASSGAVHSRGSGHRGHAQRTGAGSATQTSQTGASTGASPAYKYSSTSHSTELASSQGAGPLGLSAADLFLIALAIGALALTGGLTRRMARTQH
jgi:hypothetical protein